jgi:hypothetical protein
MTATLRGARVEHDAYRSLVAFPDYRIDVSPSVRRFQSRNQQSCAFATCANLPHELGKLTCTRLLRDIGCSQ